MVLGGFRCPNDHLTYVYQADWWNTSTLKFPSRCETEGCRDKHFQLEEDKSDFTDFQVCTLKPLKEDIIPKERVQKLDAYLTSDLVRSVEIGNNLRVSGILAVKSRSRRNVFNFVLRANYVENLEQVPLVS